MMHLSRRKEKDGAWSHFIIIEIDGMNARIVAELGYEAPVIVTGGLGREIAPHCQSRVEYVDQLLLDGLRLIWEKNKK